MQNGKLITGLNEAFNREITTAIRYLLQGSAIRGLENEPLRQLYRSEFQDELRHAQYLADKIVVLGGTPKAKPDLSPPPNEIPNMLRNDIAAEEDDVEHYRKLAGLAEVAGDIDLKLRMEEQAADEERHAEQFKRLQA